jgi:hypothetical protein
VGTTLMLILRSGSATGSARSRLLRLRCQAGYVLTLVVMLFLWGVVLAPVIAAAWP